MCVLHRVPAKAVQRWSHDLDAAPSMSAVAAPPLVLPSVLTMLPTQHPLSQGATLWVMRRSTKRRPAGPAAHAPKPAAGTEGEDASTPTAPPTTSGGAPDADDYEKNLKRAGTFNTVEGFWALYGHIVKPGDAPLITDYSVFREGVKPIWEDPVNKRGCKLAIKVRKPLTSLYYELSLLAFIGDQFGDYNQDVCGVVVSVRSGEDNLALWLRNADDHEMINKVKDMWKKILKLPGFVQMDFKRHDTSMGGAAAAASHGQAAGSSHGHGDSRPVPQWRMRSKQPQGGGGGGGGENARHEERGGGGGGAW